MRALALASLVALGGCGVSPELYGARVAEVSDLRARLDAEHKAALSARAGCDRRLAELEQENARLGDELRTARQARDEQARARADAEARASQCVPPAPPDPAPTP